MMQKAEVPLKPLRRRTRRSSMPCQGLHSTSVQSEVERLEADRPAVPGWSSTKSRTAEPLYIHQVPQDHLVQFLSLPQELPRCVELVQPARLAFMEFPE